jgi:hypothetical protein
MATTGNDLWLYTQSLIDKDYSDWLSTAKANRIFKTALYDVIEQKLAVMDNQKIYDELSFLIKTNEFVQASNSNPNSPNTIHKVPFLISNATFAAGTLTLDTELPTNMINSNSVSWGSLGFLNANNSGTSTNTVISNGTKRVQVTGLTATVLNPYPGGGFLTTPYQVTDYMRLLTIKSVFRQDKINSSGLSFSSNKITFTSKNKLRTGDKVFIESTAALGTYLTRYAKQISDKVYQFYTDLKLTSIYAPAGSYNFYYQYEEYCTPYFSDGKINKNNVPKVYEPSFEDRENSIMIYPITEVCTGVYIDYVHKPNYFIDVTNAFNDLELVYTNKFLYSVANEFANIFSAATRDPELYRSIENEIIQNP